METIRIYSASTCCHFSKNVEIFQWLDIFLSSLKQFLQLKKNKKTEVMGSNHCKSAQTLHYQVKHELSWRLNLSTAPHLLVSFPVLFLSSYYDFLNDRV